MRISIEQSGGFAGLRRSAVMDTDELDAAEAEELVRLVEGADFFALPTVIESPRPQPDRFRYVITVSREDGGHTVSVGEEAMPAGLALLVRRLVGMMG
jgi:hypothetical protein